MSIRWKSRTVALCALALGMFSGALLSTLIVHNTHADAQPATTVEPERTCYVDFVKVLKEDAVLLSVQIEIYSESRQRQRDLSTRTERLMKAKQEDIRNKQAKSEEYARLMEEIIQLNANYTKERYDIELDMQKDINEEAKRRFNKLRDYAVEIAERHKATQILVISTEPTEKMDFSDLQKALMLSPVLHYTKGYDITAELKARADLDKCNFETTEAYAQGADGKKIDKLPEDKEKNPDRIDYEIAHGAKLTMRAEFTDLNKATSKREPVANASLMAKDGVTPTWVLRGEGELKSLPNGDAEFTAPLQWPESAAKDKPIILEIDVSPLKARNQSKTLRVRVLPPPPKDK
ncbi:MAG: OmpH family outer membrane protein [Planctomycetes bacterium]|jgi:hypothetical protein|nr:OmpH family outer membrane protein [Planctomycetota bacterium]